jgi:outer membrane protein assembly factor BamB
VIDSEDYAPRDPEVQRKEQVKDNSTSTERQQSTEAETDAPPEDSNKAISGGWPTFQYDRFNTGYKNINVKSNSIKKEWTFSTDGTTTASPTIIENILYIGDHSGKLYAIEASTGNLIWENAIGREIYNCVDSSGKYIIAGNEDGNVYAVSKNDGNLAWRQNIGRTALGQTLVDGTVYVSRSGYGQVVSVDVSRGSVNWKYEASGGIRSNIESHPAVTDNKVIFGSANSQIIVVDRDAGTEVWSYDTGGPRVKGDPSVHNGTVFAVNNGGSVKALGLSDGSEIWTYEIGSDTRASPAIDGDKVYLGSRNGRIYALDATTGNEQWTFNSGGEIRSSIAVTSEQMFFGNDEKVYSLNKYNGAVNWEYQTDGRVSPVAVTQNVLFGTTTSGTVFALSFE